jgi:hypothetical protein
MRDICSAWQQLYSCLGTTYYSCFNPVYLISQGYGLQQSFQFTAEILRTQFKCVGGFERTDNYPNANIWIIMNSVTLKSLSESIKQYPCIMGALQNTAAQNLCFAPYNQTLNGNYSQICEFVALFVNKKTISKYGISSRATQNLTNCFENIFASCGVDAQWWACEDIRVGFALFSCPNHRCNVSL